GLTSLSFSAPPHIGGPRRCGAFMLPGSDDSLRSTLMSSPYTGGPHELGQNFLIDRSVISTVADLVNSTCGPIVEIGPGAGALTMPLSRLDRSLTAVEVEAKRARRLQRRTPEHVTAVNADMLRYRFPRFPHLVVG